MESLQDTLASLAPGVASSRPLEGEYNPRHGLAIYFLPTDGYPLIQPGTVLGEALASRSGLGCTMLEGIPQKIPNGAVVVGLYDDLQKVRPDLISGLVPPIIPGEYTIMTGKSTLITAASRDGLISGMHTLAMIILRHQEDTVPAAVVRDWPARNLRGLAIELGHNEIIPALLFQIMSFATTFKANFIEWIVPANLDTGALGNFHNLNDACHSSGVEISVAMPLLADVLAGNMPPRDAWRLLQTAAKVFDADRVALDDACPPGVDPEAARRVVESLMEEDHDLPPVMVDARLFAAAGVDLAALDPEVIVGRHRLAVPDDLPPPGLRDELVVLDVPAHTAGLSARSLEEFHTVLDAAHGWSGGDSRGNLIVSFRNIGIPHAWQNYLPAAAAGLIAGWGQPAAAEAATLSFAHLLYGDSGAVMTEIWRSLGNTFPGGLTPENERRLREIAFGSYPESDADRELLVGVDWQQTVERINHVAALLESVGTTLSRNKNTLTGPYLSLQMLAWLCRLAYLLPEVERLLTEGNDDVQAGRIADELMASYCEWREYIITLQGESGLETVDMSGLNAMGHRLGFICGAPHEE